MPQEIVNSDKILSNTSEQEQKSIGPEEKEYSPSIKVQQDKKLQSNQKAEQKSLSKEENINSEPQSQKLGHQSILEQLKQINQTIIYDISVKKGRKQKFLNHTNRVLEIKKDFENQISIFSEKDQSSIYEKLSIIYYNLARLGQNDKALQTAISVLQLSKSSRYLAVRWNMQLAAMKSSMSHKAAHKIAVQTMSKILKIVQDLAENIKQQKPKLSYFLELVLKVIRSDRKNDFIWIHNFQNNMKCFTDHIKLLMASSDQNQQDDSHQKQSKEPITNSSNIKVQPFYPGYDFQIADYMSLQKLQFDYIEKYNESTDIKEIAKQIVIYASICCFTQATESYYMGDYSLKYLHFKAIEVALLTVDKECTYVGFLLKILNDYYGAKMSQIRQENSQIMEVNELRRKMPKDKRQVSLKNISFADQ